VSAYRRDIIASFASVGAAAQGASGATAPDGSPQRFIRALPLVSTEQVFGYERRTPTNRFNPYRRPGDLDELAQGLDSFSCAHTANPPLTRPIGSSPPCETAEPWPFEGRVRSYPRLRRYQP
jgi:hypothetical protein